VIGAAGQWAAPPVSLPTTCPPCRLYLTIFSPAPFLFPAFLLSPSRPLRPLHPSSPLYCFWLELRAFVYPCYRFLSCRLDTRPFLFAKLVSFQIGYRYSRSGFQGKGPPPLSSFRHLSASCWTRVVRLPPLQAGRFSPSDFSWSSSDPDHLMGFSFLGGAFTKSPALFPLPFRKRGPFQRTSLRLARLFPPFQIAFLSFFFPPLQ